MGRCRTILFSLALAAVVLPVQARDLIVRRALPKPVDPVGLERAKAAQERHTHSMMRRDGVVGTALSWGEDGEPVIRIYTSERGVDLPNHLDGVPVEAERTGQILAVRESPQIASATAIEDPSDRFDRPVPIGVSVGDVNTFAAGTIGCRVTTGCHQYVLSNNHVVAKENLNTAGATGVNGTSIVQPGKYDGGVVPDDRIGRLYDFVPILGFVDTDAYKPQNPNTHPTYPNRVDAAIVEVTLQTAGKSTPNDGYGVPRSETLPNSAALLNTDVMKYGRTTSITYGYIDAWNASLHVEFNSGMALFTGQIIVKPSAPSTEFSMSGDSGALIVADGGNDDRKPVGLLFASGVGVAVANPIDEVLSAFSVSIDGDP